MNLTNITMDYPALGFDTLEINATTIIHGWLWSWTTCLLTLVIICLLLWNVYLTWKCSQKTGFQKKGGKENE